jgi:hypothetical protein
VLKFAFELEQIAAQTYQGVGMKLSTPMLRQTAMTVGGVEARHMAILAHFIRRSPRPMRRRLRASALAARPGSLGEVLPGRSPCCQCVAQLRSTGRRSRSDDDPGTTGYRTRRA